MKRVFIAAILLFVSLGGPSAQGTDRTASAWFSDSSFAFDVNLTDGAAHQVSLYAVDWDSTTRTERVDVLDTTGAVIDSRTLSAFHGGQYLSWRLSGHVKLVVTNTNPTNAVVSGVFFDAAPTGTGVFIGSDTTTQGNWTGKYGADGHAIGYTINGAMPGILFPSYARVEVLSFSVATWEATTSDARALQRPAVPTPVPPTVARATSYDESYKALWVPQVKHILSLRTTTPGLVPYLDCKTLAVGDSLTYSQAYGFWPLNGHAGATAFDLAAIACMHADVYDWPNGWLGSFTGRTADSGMAWWDDRVDRALMDPMLNNAPFAVMMCGVPDWMQPTDVHVVREKMQDYIAAGVVPILSTIPPRVTWVALPSGRSFDDEVTIPYNAELRKLAREFQLPYIDFWAEVVATRPGDSWHLTLISDDGIHPSGGGPTYGPGSDPYADGGAAIVNSGYLLRTMLTIWEIGKIKAAVFTSDPQPVAPTRLNTPFIVSSVDPSKEPLLHAENLVYQGGFLLPADGAAHGGPEGSGFAWTSRGLAFFPEHNSLLVNGHSWYQYTAEVSIPTPSLDPDQRNWPVATWIQDFGDTEEGHKHEIGSGGELYPAAVELGGIFPYGGKLIGDVLAVYDSTNFTRRSFYSHSLTTAVNGSFKGLFTIGNEVAQAFYSGYMAATPLEWVPLLGGPVFAGQSGASIIFRQSLGPAATFFDPNLFGTVDPVPASSLVYYSVDHPGLGQYSGDTPPGSDFSMGVVVGGAAFPAGSRTVLFIGRQGVGSSCYGSSYNLTGSGTVTIEQNIELVYNPCWGVGNSHGNNSVPYKNWVWAYDANDLLAVAKGTKLAYDVKPYDVFPIELSSDNGQGVVGVGYDPKTQTLYLGEPGGAADGITLVIRAYHVNLTIPKVADVTPPTTPTNVAVEGLSSHQTRVTWNASTDDTGVVRYKVFRNGKQLAIVRANTGIFSGSPYTYNDYNLWASTAYSYSVQAVDAAGNVSPMSASASATTHSVPGAPNNLKASISNGQTVLTWEPTTDDHGVPSAYYKIFSEPSAYNVLAITSDLTFTDTKVAHGADTTYVVVALDSGLKYGGQAGVTVTVP